MEQSKQQSPAEIKTRLRNYIKENGIDTDKLLPTESELSDISSVLRQHWNKYASKLEKSNQALFSEFEKRIVALEKNTDRHSTEELMSLGKKFVEDLESNPLIDKLEQKAKLKFAEDAVKNQLLEEKIQNELSEGILSRFNLYVVAGAYLDIKKEDGTIAGKYTSSELAYLYPKINGELYRTILSTFVDTHYSEKRTFKRFNPSWNQTDPEVLNTLSKKGWLQSEDNDADLTNINFIISNITGHNQQDTEHFMRLIGWKRLHPEDFMIPMIMLFGMGNSGKTSVANTLMKTIFGDNQVKVTNVATYINQNSDGIGKTVVYFDEGRADDNNELHSFLKRIVFNREWTCTDKWFKSKEFDTTAMYIYSCNPIEHLPSITRDGTDRRWQLFESKSTLAQALCKKKGLAFSEENLDECQKEVFEIVECLKDPKVVAKWLYQCEEIAKLLGERPTRMHNEASDKAHAAQKTTHEEMFDDLFINIFNEETNISKVSYTSDDLFEHYRQRILADNPSAKATKKKHMLSALHSWLANHNLQDEIEYKNVWNPLLKKAIKSYVRENPNGQE